jgi:hypothetical protein
MLPSNIQTISSLAAFELLDFSSCQDVVEIAVPIFHGYAVERYPLIPRCVNSGIVASIIEGEG